MRISELSEVSGVTVATIKYYLREGLVPSGKATAPNQADYDEAHLRRLDLIRVLVDVGGLGLSAVRQVIRALEDEKLPLHDLLGVAQRALAGTRRTEDVIDAEADKEIDEFIDDLEWKVSPTTPARDDLAAALSALRKLGWDVSSKTFRPYARVAFELARREVQVVGGDISKTEAIERFVVGTVVFERVLAALRRLAHEHHSALRFRS
jgi:DNA-binding transcriptional MerR regulator